MEIKEISYEEQQLQVMCEKVRRPDAESMEQCRQNWDQIAKPLSGLGRLEHLITRIAGIHRQPAVSLKRRAVVVFCSDNGVVEEGVTQTDSHVTKVVTENLAKGITSVNRMAVLAEADVLPVDIGVAADIRELGVRNAKVAYGTRNFCREAAMTRQQALAGILEGIRIAGEMKNAGYDIAAVGEMGIGNTTTASAVAGVLLQLPAAAVTGTGAGLSDEGLRRKVAAIEKGIALHRPDPQDPLEVLATVGGFDLAGMCGMLLGGAIYQLPVILDGVISAAAALLAVRLCPLAKEYMLASHVGKEPASRLLLQNLGLEPVIQAELALGEGTGAVLLLPMLDMALAVYQDKTTFADIQIDSYKRYE